MQAIASYKRKIKNKSKKEDDDDDAGREWEKACLTATRYACNAQ